MTPRPLTPFPQGRYLTYPTANGFLDEGDLLVVGERRPGGFALVALDRAAGTERVLDPPAVQA